MMMMMMICSCHQKGWWCPPPMTLLLPHPLHRPLTPVPHHQQPQSLLLLPIIMKDVMIMIEKSKEFINQSINHLFIGNSEKVRNPSIHPPPTPIPLTHSYLQQPQTQGKMDPIGLEWFLVEFLGRQSQTLFL